ncbi:hypothetical protein OAT08_03470 [Pelagibacteraceae bacterium]|jgi:hypothetical protein|nr:hypothetical protein [Pelagibacteraceae bacterium]
MYKVFNLIIILLILFFSLSTYKYYLSNINIQKKEYNRTNIDQIIKKKIVNIPTLTNDTNNVIEFNNSLSNEISNTKTRNFWNLLKSK